jgi:hypothetical protein
MPNGRPRKQGVNADLKDFQGTEQEGVARKYDDWNQTAFTKGVPDEAQAAIYNAYGNSAKADELFGKLKQSPPSGSCSAKRLPGRSTRTTRFIRRLCRNPRRVGTGSAYAAQQADLLKKVLDDKYKALHDSPASFVVGDSGPLKSKWDAFSKAQAAAQTAPGDAAAANAGCSCRQGRVFSDDRRTAPPWVSRNTRPRRSRIRWRSNTPSACRTRSRNSARRSRRRS